AERPLPESFLKRFAQEKVRVVWSSQCEYTGPMNGFQDKETHRRALLMKIIDIRWADGREVEGQVEAFSDGIAANWNTLHLKFENGRWSVKVYKVDGVS